jgi:hypothetical protein
MNDAAWSYGAVLSPVEAKEYLLKDPRMGVHVRAFLKVRHHVDVPAPLFTRVCAR